MKTKQPPAKLPKRRKALTMIVHPEAWDNPPVMERRILWAHNSAPYSGCTLPVAVLPAATKAQARQMVKAHKFLSMTREEQVEAIAKTIPRIDLGRNIGGDWEPDMQPDIVSARAVLATIYGEAKP